MVVLTNELVTIRSTIQADMFPLANAASDPKIWEKTYNSLSDLYNFSQLFIREFRNKHLWTILDKESNVIGMINTTNPHDYIVEVKDSFLIRKCWGGVYNRAVKELLFNHIFQHADEIKIYIHQDNIRSQKANIKLGFKLECAFIVNKEYRLTKKRWKQFNSKTKERIPWL